MSAVRIALAVAVAAAIATLAAGLYWPAVIPAVAEEPCIRASQDYQRVYPPQGTILNRRPAEWQICTPWGNRYP